MIRDLLERAVRTFVQAFLAALFIAGPVADLSMARTAAMAAFAAGISAVFSLVASVFGVRGSASMDPANTGAALTRAR